MKDRLDEWEMDAMGISNFDLSHEGVQLMHNKILTLIKAHRVMRGALKYYSEGEKIGRDLGMTADKAIAEADHILKGEGSPQAERPDPFMGSEC